MWTEHFRVTSWVTAFSRNGTPTAASGHPVGTTAMAHVTQRGLFDAGVPTGCPAGDCWPAELAFYKPIGQ